MEHGENDTVRRFAKSIASVQRTEIAELNNQREKLGLGPIVVDETSGPDAHGEHR